MTEETPQEEQTTPEDTVVDVIWVVAHILAIINFIENTHGLEAINDIARLAAYLEVNMRAEEAKN